MLKVLSDSGLSLKEQFGAIGSLEDFVRESNIDVETFNHPSFLSFISVLCKPRAKVDVPPPVPPGVPDNGLRQLGLRSPLQLARNDPDPTSRFTLDTLSEGSVAPSAGVPSVIHDGLVHDQGRDPTCWAHAIAQVLIATHKRLDGRTALPQDHVVDYLVRKYPKHEGWTTEEVLRRECSKRRLDCYPIDEEDAISVLKKNRMVLARFDLDQEEWDIFDRFFQHNPKETLTKDVFRNPKHYIDGYRPPKESEQKVDGHSIVITKFVDRRGFKIKNSWGDQWANEGYGYIGLNAIPGGMQMYDVGRFR